MAVRKSDIVRNLEAAAGRVETAWSKSVGGNGVVQAICPKNTAGQLAALSVFASFVHSEYGASNLNKWNDSQVDRRKIARALRRASRQVRSGELTVR